MSTQLTVSQIDFIINARRNHLNKITDNSISGEEWQELFDLGYIDFKPTGEGWIEGYWVVTKKELPKIDLQIETTKSGGKFGKLPQNYKWYNGLVLDESDTLLYNQLSEIISELEVTTRHNKLLHILLDERHKLVNR